jgi:hypothetical protein
VLATRLVRSKLLIPGVQVKGSPSSKGYQICFASLDRRPPVQTSAVHSPYTPQLSITTYLEKGRGLPESLAELSIPQLGPFPRLFLHELDEWLLTDLIPCEEHHVYIALDIALTRQVGIILHSASGAAEGRFALASGMS